MTFIFYLHYIEDTLHCFFRTHIYLSGSSGKVSSSVEFFHYYLYIDLAKGTALMMTVLLSLFTPATKPLGPTSD